MRVLCINADFSNQRERRNYKNILSLPKEGHDYTIKKIIKKNGQVGYTLNELFAGYGDHSNEICFSSDRFILLEPVEVELKIEEICFN